MHILQALEQLLPVGRLRLPSFAPPPLQLILHTRAGAAHTDTNCVVNVLVPMNDLVPEVAEHPHSSQAMQQGTGKTVGACALLMQAAVQIGQLPTAAPHRREHPAAAALGIRLRRLLALLHGLLLQSEEQRCA